MITGDHKRTSHKVRKADRGGARDVQYQSARLHNRLVEERSDLEYVSHSNSSSRKRPSQLMPATRDELFTHLSNQ